MDYINVRPKADEYQIKTKKQMLRRNGLVVKSVEPVLRLEGSLWWERFVEEVGLEAGLKERGSYGLMHSFAASGC